MVGNIVMNFQNWSGMSDTRYGYGALRAGFRDHVLDGIQNGIVSSGIRFDGRASSVVWMGLPDHFPGALEGAYKTLFTMIETDKVPDGWLPFLAEFDQIIVPCEANVRVFEKLHPNVVKVPLGFDRNVWHPQDDRQPNKRFRFHAGGSLWTRKGLDLVLGAFLKLGVDAELHLKCAPHMMDMPKVSARHDIVIHRDWMSEQTLVQLVRKADCWVAPSRGEGFGLMPLQAVACGVPTILSDTSGHREYAHLASRVVPTNRVPALSGGMWDECEPDALALAMLSVYENAPKARSEALARVGECDTFSWVNASKRLLDTLPMGQLLPADAKFVPCQPLVTVSIGKTCAPDIAGTRYKFIAGNEYQVPVNVRDVLSVSGHLIV